MDSNNIMSRRLANTITKGGSLAMNTQMDNFFRRSNIGSGLFGDAKLDRGIMDSKLGNSFNTEGAGRFKMPQTKFSKGMGLANLAMDGAGLMMNYRQMKATNKYNAQNMALLQEQQGLAKRAADTNYANQQSMAAQMI